MAAKSANSGKEKLIEEEEEVLQAVILADSFNKRFRPLTTRKPRCLLPICNAPLLDWTFESLALAGVQEVFVICRSHAELVKEAIKDSKWSKPGSGMKIVPIMTAKETFSPGDAMRDIYTRGLVTSDFVLVMGDLVSNIRIDEVVRVHKERRRTNKDAIMTMVVKESGERHRTRPTGESSVFVLDPETSECLHYEPAQGHPKKKNVKIPREIFAAHPELDIRNDLLDCCIDVCSVEVPSLFQDNFDYLDIRKDFVHGILTSDILMKNIYCYVAEEGYAARVQDTRSYESISKDILSRWTFPLVPDDNHPGGHIYEHTRGNRYIAKDNSVVLARTCNIGTNTLIGSSTTVGDNVSINASVIGQKCRIGAGSTIRNSYLFEGAVIGENCTIERSIIGAGVNIKDNSKVAKGCLIADGVIVGPNAAVKPFERLSVRRNEADIAADEDDDDSDIEEVETHQDDKDRVSLGKDTNAIVWPRGPSADEEEDEEGPENFKNQRFMRLGESASDLGLSDEEEDLSSESESESSSDEEDNDRHDGGSISGLSDVSMQPLDSGMGLMADKEFQAEVQQSLDRAFDEGHSTENAAVELKTLRMASNVPLTRVKEAVMSAIVERIPVVENDPATQRKEIAQIVGRWGQLINLIGGIDPVETIAILQAHCASSTRMSLFGQILAALYQEDIVEEDDIRAWHRQKASHYVEGVPSHADQAGVGEKMTAVERENANKCWVIGAAMISQFDAQESDSDEETGEDSESENEKPAAASAPAAQKQAAAASSSGSDSDSASDSDEEKATPTVAATVPKFVADADKSAESSDKSSESSDADSDSEKEDEKAPVAGSSKTNPPPASVSSADSTDDSESEADPEEKAEPVTSSKATAEDKSAESTGDDESEVEAGEKVKEVASTASKQESKSAESTDDSDSEAETPKEPSLAVRDRSATVTAASSNTAPKSTSANSTDDESDKEAEGETRPPSSSAGASTTSISTEVTTPTAEIPAPLLTTTGTPTPAPTTRDRAATVTLLNAVVPVLTTTAVVASVESSDGSTSSESEAEPVSVSKVAVSSPPKASTSTPAPVASEDDSDSNNTSSNDDSSFVKVTNTNPVISLPSGADLASSMSSASGSSLLTPVPGSSATDSTGSDSDSDAPRAAHKHGKAKAKVHPGATLQAPVPRKAQSLGQAAAGAAASVANAILGRLSPSRSFSNTTSSASTPAVPAAAVAPVLETPATADIPGSSGSSTTSLVAIRAPAPVLESSGDEADDGDAEESTDDGMSDAISASEGSAAPSANASDNEDEDDDMDADVDALKAAGKKVAPPAGELRD